MRVTNLETRMQRHHIEAHDSGYVSTFSCSFRWPKVTVAAVKVKDNGQGMAKGCSRRYGVVQPLFRRDEAAMRWKWRLWQRSRLRTALHASLKVSGGGFLAFGLEML